MSSPESNLNLFGRAQSPFGPTPTSEEERLRQVFGRPESPFESQAKRIEAATTGLSEAGRLDYFRGYYDTRPWWRHLYSCITGRWPQHITDLAKRRQEIQE